MRTNGKWQIKSSEIVYKNNWISVVEDQVIRPDGNDGMYGTVRIQQGISVLPVDQDNNVYLIREFKYPIEEFSIETAAGGQDPKEDALTAAKRELVEELGITAATWTDLGVVKPVTSFIDCPNQLFIAQDLTFSNSALEGTEDIEMMKMPLSEALKMVMDGRIVEQKTCCLILKAGRLLKV